MYLWCLHEASQLLGIYGSVVLMKPAKALLRVGYFNIHDQGYSCGVHKASQGTAMGGKLEYS